MKSGEVRATRLRTIMQHAPKVKSREELITFAQSRFGVTRATAEDYIEAVIAHVKRNQGK